MKKLIIMLAMAFAAALPLMADMEMVDGIAWNYTVSNGKVYIYKNGSMAAIPIATTGAITIPSSLGGYPVTSIGYNAFQGCRGLTSVIIPDSVTSIDDNAFHSCSGLTSVIIPDSVTSIGDKAFEWCSGLTSVTIPDSVTSIGGGAFSHCSGLKNVVIGSGLTSIGGSAFYDCDPSLFDTTTIPGVKLVDGWAVGYNKALPSDLNLTGARGIGAYAFEDCSELTRVTIPGSVMSIGGKAFNYCSGLTSVTIGNGVMNIGSCAFYGCRSLTSLTVPASVKSIRSMAFYACQSLKSIVLPKWCKTVKVYYNVYESEWEVLNNAVTRPDWWPASFVFYAFCSHNGDNYVHYKDYEKQITRTIKITYKDVGGSSSGGEVADIWKKAQTFDGGVFMDGKTVGVIQVKVGKASKNGEVAVSGTITGLDGKKRTAKGGKVAVNGETATATLTAKDGTSATVTVGAGGVSGSWNGAEISMAAVGGNWTRTDACVYVDFDGGNPLPDDIIEELLPIDDGEAVLPKNGKWAFNKAATVKLSKDKTTAEWDTSKGKSNLSAMKLTYTPKTGMFKGSFTVYALEESKGGKKKLKKYKAKVTGVVVDGVGYGQATMKKPAGGPWIVTVE